MKHVLEMPEGTIVVPSFDFGKIQSLFLREWLERHLDPIAGERLQPLLQKMLASPTRQALESVWAWGLYIRFTWHVSKETVLVAVEGPCPTSPAGLVGD